MRHLRLVPTVEAAVADRAAAPPGNRRPGARTSEPAPTADALSPLDSTLDSTLEDGVPLLYVPARLLLALAGRCSCVDCCTAYAEHRPEPHDPRRYDDRPRLRAI
jgi:hypothetical protein